MQHMQGNVAYMFDYWSDLIVQFLINAKKPHDCWLSAVDSYHSSSLSMLLRTAVLYLMPVPDYLTVANILNSKHQIFSSRALSSPVLGDRRQP